MKERIADWTFTVAMAILLALFVISFTDNVHAEPVEAPSCEAVAQANGIVVYYCQDIDLYVNSLGFMVQGN